MDRFVFILDTAIDLAAAVAVVAFIVLVIA